MRHRPTSYITRYTFVFHIGYNLNYLTDFCCKKMICQGQLKRSQTVHPKTEKPVNIWIFYLDYDCFLCMLSNYCCHSRSFLLYTYLLRSHVYTQFGGRNYKITSIHVNKLLFKLRQWNTVPLKWNRHWSGSVLLKSDGILLKFSKNSISFKWNVIILK